MEAHGEMEEEEEEEGKSWSDSGWRDSVYPSKFDPPHCLVFDLPPVGHPLSLNCPVAAADDYTFSLCTICSMTMVMSCVPPRLDLFERILAFTFDGACVGCKKEEENAYTPIRIVLGFRVLEVLGSGADSAILRVSFITTDMYSDRVNCAVKLVWSGRLNEKPHRLLHVEGPLLESLQGSPYFPRLLFFLGRTTVPQRPPPTGSAHYTCDCTMICMDVLGPSLRDLVLSTEEVLNVAQCVVRGLKDLHARGYVHFGLKPENLCWSSAKSHSSCVIVDLERAVKVSPKIHQCSKNAAWGGRSGIFFLN